MKFYILGAIFIIGLRRSIVHNSDARETHYVFVMEIFYVLFSIILSVRKSIFNHYTGTREIWSLYYCWLRGRAESGGLLTVDDYSR